MKKFAVIGNPVAHSRSPEIHAFFARQADIDMSYERIEAPTSGFIDTVRSFIDEGADGFNVTVPFKHEAFELVDQPSDIASRSGAVNTVTVLADGQLKGDNTDGDGLVADITKNLGWEIRGKRILVLGAGGAVAGVLPKLVEAAPSLLQIANRTHSKAELIADLAGAEAVRLEDVESSYDLVISGTSAGLSGSIFELPGRIIGKATRCYDMIYDSNVTMFNHWAEELGAAETSDGLGMLVEQAARAFTIWLDFEPDTVPVINAIRELLKRS